MIKKIRDTILITELKININIKIRIKEVIMTELKEILNLLVYVTSDFGKLINITNNSSVNVF